MSGPLLTELREMLRSAEDRISADLSSTNGHVDGALRLAIRKALEEHIVPCVADVVATLEARFNDKTDILSKRLTELERVSLALSDEANKQPNLSDLLTEALAPLSEPETVRGLINSGDYDEAIVLAITDDAALDELLAAELADAFVSKINDEGLKKEFTLAIIRHLSNQPEIQKVEWIMESILSIKDKDADFLEEVASALSSVDCGEDRKTQAKVKQCLKLVKSIQW